MRSLPITLTYRRRLIDKYLQSAKSVMKGAVAEVGGTESRHGRFRPPRQDCDRWVSIDVSRGQRPDIVADAHDLPLDSDRFDTIVSVELLEHVEDPRRVLTEFARIMRPGGALVMSMPFLQPFHSSPSDYQRFTDVQLRRTLDDSGFAIDSIEPMGHFFTVAAGMLRTLLFQVRPRVVAKLLVTLAWVPLDCLARLDGHLGSSTLRNFTTGYFVLARKRSERPRAS